VAARSGAGWPQQQRGWRLLAAERKHKEALEHAQQHVQLLNFGFLFAIC
jgi:hypothetical protein